MEAPSKEQWARWQADPVTKWFYWAINEVRVNTRDDMADGRCMREDPAHTAHAYANMSGRAEMCRDLMEMAPDFMESSDD